MIGELGRVAELLERLPDRRLARKPPRGQFPEPLFEMVAQLVGDFVALRGFEPQETAQKGKVKFKILLGHRGPPLSLSIMPDGEVNRARARASLGCIPRTRAIRAPG